MSLELLVWVVSVKVGLIILLKTSLVSVKNIVSIKYKDRYSEKSNSYFCF